MEAQTPKPRSSSAFVMHAWVSTTHQDLIGARERHWRGCAKVDMQHTHTLHNAERNLRLLHPAHLASSKIWAAHSLRLAAASSGTAHVD